MFDRFRDDARLLMGHARMAAQRLNHEWIGTGHVLLGLLDSNAIVATAMIDELGVSPDAIRVATEQRMTPGDTIVEMGQLPFTPNAKRALERTLEEVMALEHHWIDSGHVLLGLVALPDTVAGAALAECGVEPDAARAWMRDNRSDAAKPAPPPDPQPSRLDRLEAELDALRKRVDALEREERD